MQSTKLAAGPVAPRTDGDAPTPQNSSATTCDDCNERDAAGINPDGRSLCRPCATRSRTLVCDGGESEDTTTCERCGTEMGVFDLHVELTEKDALDTTPKGARLFLCEDCGHDFHNFLDDVDHSTAHLNAKISALSDAIGVLRDDVDTLIQTRSDVVECPDCGTRGLPERVIETDCPTHTKLIVGGRDE